MKIESKIGKSTASDQQIYSFITDFNNFQELIPGDVVSEWKSSEDRCTFQVKPIGKTGLMIIDRAPHSLIKISSIPEISSYHFLIWIQLKKVSEADTRIKITIEPEVNKMVLPMIKSPLKQFVNGLVDKIEAFDFSS
jgi:carbon monoxide dehydrogenase subunit G